ncbi:MRG family protein [Chloropicon roscoffensis]|uniref:MRG family protein n=3 Tax=Chloropicon roscoffensis TaxID=1461544 RepID=A0AAX4P077_9CHLO
MAQTMVANGAGMNPSESPYSEGDKVIIPQQSLVYEAKVEKVQFDAKVGWKYFVHYMGWNKKYDEWLPHSSLKEFDENAKLTKPSWKKTKKAEDEDSESVAKIPLPNPLKNRLVTEWDAITRESKLVPLPKEKHTVSQILDSFSDTVERREPWAEITDGLKDYFDKSLKAMLLYPQEVAQAGELLGSDKDTRPRDVYGVEHLVRLFVKLPDILPYTNMDDESMTQLIARLSTILNFVKDNADDLYSVL